MTPEEIDFYLTQAGNDKIQDYIRVVIGTCLVTHCPSLKSCKKYIKSVFIALL